MNRVNKNTYLGMKYWLDKKVVRSSGFVVKSKVFPLNANRFINTFNTLEYKRDRGLNKMGW